MNASLTDQTPTQAERRRLLKLAGLGLGLGMLPLALRINAAPSVREFAAGYWRGGAALGDFGVISRGWGEACARAIASCDTTMSDELVSAARVSGAAGSFRLRLIGAEFARPVQVEADFDGTRHGIWSGWRSNKTGGSSAMLAIRWQSLRGESLPLMVNGSAESMAVAIPARAGVYVVPLERHAFGWREMALHAPDAAAVHRRRLRARDGTTPPSYLLVAVEPIVEPQAA